MASFDATMMVRADAKAIGMVTSVNPRVSERWKSSGSHRASACISYYNADRSDAVIFRDARTERKAMKRSANADAAKVDSINKHDAARKRSAADLAPIGDSNH